MTHDESPHKPDGSARRAERFRLRGWLWRNTQPKLGLRVGSCGRKRVAEFVQVRAGHERAGLGGVSTCSSVWACPVCSAKVAETRAREVEDTVRAWQAYGAAGPSQDGTAQGPGGSVLLVTLTLSHSRKHKLAKTWDAVAEGWAAVRNGNGWKADQARFGIAGFCRVVEVTHSRVNGWHPHAHVLLFTTRDLDPDEQEALRARVFKRWSDRLRGLGYTTLDLDRDGNAVGVDVRSVGPYDVAHLAGYLTKFGYVPRSTGQNDSETGWTIAREVARGDLKRGRKGSQTPWEILEEAAQGSQKARRRWYVWEKASKGRRQYSWSRGFREALRLAPLVSDEEAALAHDQVLPVALLLPPATWSAMVKDLRAVVKATTPRTAIVTQVLDLAAAGDLDGAGRLLDRLGLAWERPGEGTSPGSHVVGATTTAPLVPLGSLPQEVGNRLSQARRDSGGVHALASVTPPDRPYGFVPAPPPAWEDLPPVFSQRERDERVWLRDRIGLGYGPEGDETPPPAV